MTMNDLREYAEFLREFVGGGASGEKSPVKRSIRSLRAGKSLRSTRVRRADPVRVKANVEVVFKESQ